MRGGCLLPGEKPFLCEADGCGRSFAEYSSLRKHMLVHSGEWEFTAVFLSRTPVFFFFLFCVVLSRGVLLLLQFKSMLWVNVLSYSPSPMWTSQARSLITAGSAGRPSPSQAAGTSTWERGTARRGSVAKAKKQVLPITRSLCSAVMLILGLCSSERPIHFKKRAAVAPL